MNTQQLQGSWNRIRGQVKERWGSLTDDDLMLHGGDIDRLVGTIQQKTGETREAVEEFLNHATSRSASMFSQAAETAGQYAQHATHQLRDQYRQIADHMGDGYEHMQDSVRQRPGHSIATALGVGLAVGFVVGLSLRSR